MKVCIKKNQRIVCWKCPSTETLDKNKKTVIRGTQRLFSVTAGFLQVTGYRSQVIGHSDLFGGHVFKYNDPQKVTLLSYSVKQNIVKLSFVISLLARKKSE